MEEVTTPPTTRELASRGDMLPVRAEDPITVVVERRRGLHPAIYLAVGVSIGVGATIAAIGTRGGNAPSLVQANGPVRVPVPVAPVVGAQTINPNGAAKPVVPGTAGALASNVAPNLDAASPSGPAPTGNEPVDPFATGMIVPSVPTPRPEGGNPFRGMILPRELPTMPSTPAAPIQPGVGARKPNPLDSIVAQGLPQAPPVLPIKRDPPVLPTKRDGDKNAKVVDAKPTPGSNSQQTASDLIAYVTKAGGKAHSLTEKGEGDKSIVRGVQATVPDAAVPDLLKYATSIGAAMVDRTNLTGNPAERGQRLAQEAESRLASLKKLREALLVTYLEDAQPVKDVDADIADAQRAIDEAKENKAPEKMSVVKFSFTK